jgi:hypothetical protein
VCRSKSQVTAARRRRQQVSFWVYNRSADDIGLEKNDLPPSKARCLNRRSQLRMLRSFGRGDEVFGARDPGHPGIFIKTDEK